MDINCDMGESYGRFRIGNDASLMPHITSCNIACGFHGGDPLTIKQTVNLARDHQVWIGAHPSFPDLQGFGRRKMEIGLADFKALMQYQLYVLSGMAKAEGKTTLHHVKPHGALYHFLSQEKHYAIALMQIMQDWDDQLILYGAAHTPLSTWAAEMNVPFWAEAFMDRRYEADGTLRARKYADAVLTDPQEAVEQALQIIEEQKVRTQTGEWIDIEAQTLCIHGDNASAQSILQLLQQSLHA
ncbi:MAG: 5-oxoprolinase subunit PxpA [Bacteroidota bacterium]